MKAKLTSALCVLAVMGMHLISAQGEDAFNSLGQALGHYHKKEFKEAHELLTKLVDGGASDSRVYYFRGLARYQLDRVEDARSDFESGARMEATGKSRVDISRALERVQGPARQILEKYRRDAKRQANLDGTKGRFTEVRETERIFVQALSAYFKKDFKQSRELLDGLVAARSNDPRVYYFRGLSARELGDTKKSDADFKTAVGIEVTSQRNQISVDKALERVQGDSRRALESQRRVALNVIRVAEKERSRRLIAKLLDDRAVSDAELAALSRPRSVPTNTGPNEPMPEPPAANPPTTDPPVVTTTPPAAGSGAVDLAWLPSDTAVIIRLNIRELWTSPLVRKYHAQEMVAAAIGQMQQIAGLTPAGIESITMGIPDVGAIAIKGPQATREAKLEQKMIMVIRFRSPFNTQLLQGVGFETADYNGKTYYTNPAEADLPNLYMPDTKTVVAGMGATFTTAIDSGGQSDPRPEFDFLNPKSQILIGYIPDDPTILTSEIPDKSLGSPAMDKLKDAAKDNLLGVSFGVKVQDSVELQLGFVCLDDVVATELSTAFAATLKELKGLLDLVKASVPPQVSGIGDTLLRSTKTSATKEIFAVKITITEPLIARVMAAVTEFGDQLPIPGIGRPGPPPGAGNPPPGIPGNPPPGTRPNPPPQQPGAGSAQPGSGSAQPDNGN